MTKQKRNLPFIIPITIVGLLFFLLAAPFLVATLYNNYCLYRFSSQLFNYKLPPNTKIIEKHDTCGKLVGNGNGMDFLSVILIKSDLSCEELQEYYDLMDIKSARVDVSPLDGPFISVIVPSSSILGDGIIDRTEIRF